MSAAFSHEQPSGRIKPGGPATSGERSEDRVVKRGPPRSHLHRAAPSFSVPGLHVASSGALPFGADDVEDGTRRDSAWVGTRRKPRQRESSAGRHRKVPGDGGCAGRRRRARVVDYSVSECRSRSNASVSARHVRDLHRGRARGMARRNGSSRGDCARWSGERARRCGGCGAPLSTEVRSSLRFVRASLVGIAPGGVRARRLGKSQGRERMTFRYDGRVPGPVDASL